MAMNYTRGYNTQALIRTLYARKNQLDTQMLRVAEQEATAIMELSKSYAPIDEGHLEEAHRVVERNTRSGNFAYDVDVDPTIADVGEYLDFIHNHQYNLGPLSEAKAATTGQPVGNQFLTRAFDKKRPEVVAKMRLITKNFTRP